MTSVKLWGIMFVDIPTAIPLAPFISKLGNLAGKNEGSFRLPSKLSIKLTVTSFIKSSVIFSVIGANFASVYRIAAGLSPSIDPKLP